MTTASYAAARRNQNLYRTKAQVQVGPVSIRFVTIAVVAVLALLYLNQITKTSIYGYKIGELKTKQEQLANAKRDLEIEAARLQSIQTLQKSPSVQKMVPVGAVTFTK
jgi:hypothetical protein